MKKYIEKTIENGLIISVLIGLAYLLTYVYEFGVLEYYGLPSIYADLSLINIVKTAIILLVIFYIIYLPFVLIAEVFPKIKNYLSKQIIEIIITCVIIVFFYSFAEIWAGIEVLVLLSLLILMLVLYLFMPIIKIKEKISYKEKFSKYSEYLEQKQELRNKKQEETKLLFKYKKSFATIMRILVCVVIVVLFFNSAGYKYGELRNYYLIAKDYSNKAIVYSNDDVYLLKSYKSNLMDNEFQVVPFDEIGTILEEKIGVLKLAENDENN